VNSEPKVGTRLTVKLALTRPDTTKVAPAQRTQIQTFLPRLEGRRVCILRKHAGPVSGVTSTSSTNEGLIRFTNTLANTLEKHLGMHVIQTAEWAG
jgi:hypothetical protein